MELSRKQIWLLIGAVVLVMFYRHATRPACSDFGPNYDQATLEMSLDCK